MKKGLKIALAVCVCIAAAGAAVYSLMKPVSVKAAVLIPRTVSITFTEPGSYEYSRMYTVYPLVSGEILEIAVEEGAPVSAGDVIAVVSASDYEHQIQQLNSTIAGYSGQKSNLTLQEQQEKATLSATLQGLEGQLVTLEAEIAKNKSATSSLETQIGIQEGIITMNLNNVSAARKHLREMRDYGDEYEISQARQALNNAQNIWAQSELLLEQLKEGDVPDEVYQGQRQAIEAQIEAVSQQMEQSYSDGLQQYYNAQIQAAQSSITQMREKAGQAAITAPIDGVLFQLHAKDQNLLSQQTPAACIGAAPYVEVFVPIREIDGIAPGDSVELILGKRLGDEIVPGTIVDMEEEAQTKLSALGVEERKIRVLIKPRSSGLQIGYDMDVRFTPYTFADVLTVPKTAVFQVENEDFVWVIQDGRLELRQVTKGAETRDGYIIDGGLRENDVVVTDADNSALHTGKQAVAEGG